MDISVLSSKTIKFYDKESYKVAVAILASWSIFRNPISAMNAVGCGVTLIGCMFSVYVRQKLSQKPSAPPRLELLPLVNDEPDDKL
ncbi:GDP-mannose transporter GONST5 [Camellia lanceoleosa]|uniref:GDP-mannose transporter GONST5 n=1 Tax=Camellia lanceoleosa TaxID=1840588 RepID=A0ACC0IVJ6_9ERIC|nr:GDP-mannose transporter GONST5 [Camellia lanceoleosa]